MLSSIVIMVKAASCTQGPQEGARSPSQGCMLYRGGHEEAGGPGSGTSYMSRGQSTRAHTRRAVKSAAPGPACPGCGRPAAGTCRWRAPARWARCSARPQSRLGQGGTLCPGSGPPAGSKRLGKRGQPRHMTSASSGPIRLRLRQQQVTTQGHRRRGTTMGGAGMRAEH